MMVNEYGIAPCPFCWSLHTYVHFDDQKDEHAVKCRNCGAMGPIETWGSEAAVKRWNLATEKEREATEGG